jgi:hypothetical protein
LDSGLAALGVHVVLLNCAAPSAHVPEYPLPYANPTVSSLLSLVKFSLTLNFSSKICAYQPCCSPKYDDNCEYTSKVTVSSGRIFAITSSSGLSFSAALLADILLSVSFGISYFCLLQPHNMENARDMPSIHTIFLKKITPLLYPYTIIYHGYYKRR